MDAKGKATRSRPSGTQAVDLSWYSYDRYSHAKNLSLMEWCQALGFRKLILIGRTDLTTGFRAICQDPLGAWIAPIARPPVSTLHPIEVLELAKFYAMPGYAEWIQEWKAAQGSGSDADTLLRRIFRGAPAPDALPDIHTFCLAWLTDGDGTSNAIFDRFATTAHLSIDLAASDEILVQWFKAWLRKERHLMDEARVAWRRPVLRGSGGKAKFSEADRGQWARLRVLDYIDIKIGCKSQDQKMPTAGELADILFPQKDTKVDQIDRVRQQVRKMSEWLMTVPVQRALQDQAVAEYMLALFKK